MFSFLRTKLKYLLLKWYLVSFPCPIFLIDCGLEKMVKHQCYENNFFVLSTSVKKPIKPDDAATSAAQITSFFFCPSVSCELCEKSVNRKNKISLAVSLLLCCYPSLPHPYIPLSHPSSCVPLLRSPSSLLCTPPPPLHPHFYLLPLLLSPSIPSGSFLLSPSLSLLPVFLSPSSLYPVPLPRRFLVFSSLLLRRRISRSLAARL